MAREFGFVGPYPMVVSAGVLQNSSDAFNILDPDTGGADTFSVPLSPSGSSTPTHWAANTALQEETIDALLNMNVPQFLAFVNEKAQEFGRNTIGSIVAFKNSVQIGAANEDPHEFIDGLGLQVIDDG